MNRFTDNHNKGRPLAWINLTVGATLRARSRPITAPHGSSTSGSDCDAYIPRPLNCDAQQQKDVACELDINVSRKEKPVIQSDTNVLHVVVFIHSYMVDISVIPSGSSSRVYAARPWVTVARNYFLVIIYLCSLNCRLT